MTKNVQNTVLLPDHDPSDLKLTFAGNVVKHLGVQMYAGRPVPAIAELISNAWDADASEVEILLPLDQAWDPVDESHVIVVKDNGIGMDWSMIRDAYLDVGRDRRVAEETDRSPSGRPLQGRKGIGKLAGFGIADVVEVQTVHRDPYQPIGEQVLIWFQLSLDALKKAGREPAPVEMVYAGPISKRPANGRDAAGTTVTLRQLHPRSARNRMQFRRSMTRRFLFIGPAFSVSINDEKLEPEEFPLQWRWPEKDWRDGEVEGCGPVKYWVGFTEKPLRQNEGELSGILIYTRNKVSQEATFFDVSGGITGQHGLRYLCGMVKAEWLDGGIEEPDLIATHRASIAWESPQGQALQKWGQDLIRRHLAAWAKRRSELRERQIKEIKPEIWKRIENLAPSYRIVAAKFIDKFKEIEMDPEEFEDILLWFLDALENATLRSILDRLRQADLSELAELDDLLSRMEVRAAVTLLQIIESNLAAIETLERMNLENAQERGVIAKHIEKNPWLIHPTWIVSKPEGRVSTWIQQEFGLSPQGDEGDRDRADLFCVSVGGSIHIVEIKRGGHRATTDDILQADKYRQYVLRRFEEITDMEAIQFRHIQSHLIAAELRDDAGTLARTYQDSGYVSFTTWSDLVQRAKLAHQQFRDILRQTAKVEN